MRVFTFIRGRIPLGKHDCQMDGVSHMKAIKRWTHKATLETSTKQAAELLNVARSVSIRWFRSLAKGINPQRPSRPVFTPAVPAFLTRMVPCDLQSTMRVEFSPFMMGGVSCHTLGFVISLLVAPCSPTFPSKKTYPEQALETLRSWSKPGVPGDWAKDSCHFWMGTGYVYFCDELSVCVGTRVREADTKRSFGHRNPFNMICMI